MRITFFFAQQNSDEAFSSLLTLTTSVMSPQASMIMAVVFGMRENGIG
jgi:hypothetical protein